MTPTFNKLLHQPIRLRLLAHLIQQGGETAFVPARQALCLDPGLLSVHARVLAEGGCIDITRSLVGRRTHTTYAITKAGRRAFADHMAALNNIASVMEEKPA